VNSTILLYYSFILWFCQSLSRSCQTIYHYYSAQSFIIATSRSCQTIYHYYSAQSFIIAKVRAAAHPFCKMPKCGARQGLSDFVKWHSGSTWREAAHGTVTCEWAGGGSVARARAGAASWPDRGRSGVSRAESRRASGRAGASRMHGSVGWLTDGSMYRWWIAAPNYILYFKTI
jgi:hypothetical protein